MKVRAAKLLALCGALLPWPAHADMAHWEVEVNGGLTQFSRSPDGTWWQSYWPHDEELTSLSGGIGLRYNFNERWGLRAGYEYLGKASSSSEAAEVDGPRSAEPSVPHAFFSGSGNVAGLYLGATYNPLSWLQFEAGGYYYRPRWSVNVQFHDGVWANATHQPANHLTAYAGIGIGPVHLMYYPSINASGNDELPAIYDGAVWQLQLRGCIARKFRWC